MNKKNQIPEYLERISIYFWIPVHMSVVHLQDLIFIAIVNKFNLDSDSKIRRDILDIFSALIIDCIRKKNCQEAGIEEDGEFVLLLKKINRMCKIGRNMSSREAGSQIPYFPNVLIYQM